MAVIYLRLNINTGRPFLDAKHVDDILSDFCIEHSINYNFGKYPMRNIDIDMPYNRTYASKSIYTEDLTDEQVITALMSLLGVDLTSEYDSDIKKRIDILTERKHKITPGKYVKHWFFKQSSLFHFVLPGIITGLIFCSLMLNSFLPIIIVSIWIVAKIRLDWRDIHEQIDTEIIELKKKNGNL